jgi:hypothetical protein
MNTSDMPTVEDLRAIARAAFEQLRGARKPGPRPAVSELAFAQRELNALDAGDVYNAELLRHELLVRGFTPPDDLKA